MMDDEKKFNAHAANLRAAIAEQAKTRLFKTPAVVLEMAADEIDRLEAEVASMRAGATTALVAHLRALPNDEARLAAIAPIPAAVCHDCGGFFENGNAGECTCMRDD